VSSVALALRFPTGVLVNVDLCLRSFAMPRTYNVGTLVGIVVATAAAVFAVVSIFGDALYAWIKSALASKQLLYVVAVFLLLGLLALIRELNNWRVTFQPRLRIWRETNRD
jgi:hypothetical protein